MKKRFIKILMVWKLLRKLLKGNMLALFGNRTLTASWVLPQQNSYKAVTTDKVATTELWPPPECCHNRTLAASWVLPQQNSDKVATKSIVWNSLIVWWVHEPCRACWACTTGSFVCALIVMSAHGGWCTSCILDVHSLYKRSVHGGWCTSSIAASLVMSIFCVAGPQEGRIRGTVCRPPLHRLAFSSVQHLTIF